MPVTATTAPVAMFVRSDKIILGGGAVLVVLAGFAHYAGWNSVLAFVLAAGAIGMLASLVGLSVEQLGDLCRAGHLVESRSRFGRSVDAGRRKPLPGRTRGGS